MYNFEIYTVNRERMKINVTDKEFDRKSEIRDSILDKSRIKKEAENLISSDWKIIISRGYNCIYKKYCFQSDF